MTGYDALIVMRIVARLESLLDLKDPAIVKAEIADAIDRLRALVKA